MSTISIGLIAQPTIDSSSMPSTGDTLRYSIAVPDSAVLLNFNSTGANQTWRFDSLQAIRQGLSEFISASQSGYTQVPTSRTGELLTDSLVLGTITLLDVYNFYNNSTSEYALDYRGFSTPTGFSPPFPTVIRESPQFVDKDEVYQFPLNYLDRDSSTFDFTYQNVILGVYISSRGYRINEVEAWGTITTPYGTFNCIKVKTDIVTYDTLSFGTTQFGINSHQREYKWLSPNVGIPIANLSGNVVAGVFVPGNIQYRDTLRPAVPNIFAPIAIFNADTTTVNLNGSVLFSNNTISITPATYQWSISPVTHQYINGSNANSAEPEVQFNAIGFYDVQLIATNSRGSDTLFIPSYIEVRLASGINDQSSLDNKILLYPNPVRSGEEMILETEVKINEILIFDQQSRLVRRIRPNSTNRIVINTADLESGIYILQLEAEESSIQKKIIIQ